MWEVKGELSETVRRNILSHLETCCKFKVSGADFGVTGEPLAFYDDALLCQLDLPAGCVLKTRRRRARPLHQPARYYFLYKPAVGDDVLLPLSGRAGDLVLAKSWLGLTLDDDAKRLGYARFYLAFAKTKRHSQFVNVPRSVHDLHFDRTITQPRIWGIYGSLWRYGVDDKELAVRSRFEPRGLFWFSRWRAHVPVQNGNELHDVDLHIWDIDGHVTYRRSGIIYRDPVLIGEQQDFPGRIDRPDYVRWYEALFALYRNFQALINRTAYLAATTLFAAATAVSVLFLLEIYGASFVRNGLETAAAATGLGDWTTWLKFACYYCIAYFALTTLLVLDAATMRSALLSMSPRFNGSWLDRALFALERRERRIENGYRRDFRRRVRAALGWLVVWTLYIICVFTSLQAAYRPELVENGRALADVWQVFAEQASLYVPVVFYYVGRKSLDPDKVALVSFGILLTLQLSMGLLVIRRIHRFWASSAAARASA